MSIEVLGEIEDNSVDLDALQPVSPTEDEQPESTTPAEEDKQPEEENVPFHEHPRFKELVEEKNTYKQELEAMRAEIESLKTTPPKGEVVEEQPQSNVPKEFLELYGTDATEHWEAYKRLNQQTLGNIVTRDQLSQVLREEMKNIEKEKKEQDELVAKYQTEYEGRISASATKHGIDAGKFRKWFVENPITKINPENPADYDYDIERGADLYAQIHPPADRGAAATQTDNAPTPSGNIHSLKDLANRSWSSLG
jgi:hypothetical protein